MTDTAGNDPLDDQALEKLGLDIARPAALFYDRGFWTFAAGVKTPETLEKTLEEAAQAKGVEAREDEEDAEGTGEEDGTASSADASVTPYQGPRA